MRDTTRDDQGLDDRLELVLHLRQFRSTHSPDAAAARARAQMLIQDILGSRLDVEAKAHGENYLRAHGFTDLGKAVAASRALQLAFEGFRSAGSAGRPNISLVLDSFSADEAHTSYASPSVEQKELLRLAKPCQVLITQALYDRIGPCQPLALRSFPARAGVYEFLWTSVERLDELRTETESAPTLVEPKSTASAEDTIISRPAAEPSRPTPEYPLEQLEVKPTYIPFSGEAVEQEAVPRRSRLPVIAISAAATVLVSIGLVIGLPYFGNLRFKPEVAEVQHAIQPVPPPTVNPAEPPTPPTPPITPTPPTTEPAPTKASDPEPKPPPPVSHAPAKKPETGQCLLSIHNLLQYAGKNRGQRKYEEAKQEYNQVLQCDHNNQEAKEGLARIRMEEQQN
jgi:hypothetical protein